MEAADAVVAEHDQGFAVTQPFEKGEALRDGSHGNQFRARELRDGVFFGFAHVDEGHGVTALEPRAGLLNGDFQGRLRLAS
jgi:hypothetical protein